MKQLRQQLLSLKENCKECHSVYLNCMKDQVILCTPNLEKIIALFQDDEEKQRTAEVEYWKGKDYRLGAMK